MVYVTLAVRVVPWGLAVQAAFVTFDRFSAPLLRTKRLKKNVFRIGTLDTFLKYVDILLEDKKFWPLQGLYKDTLSIFLLQLILNLSSY